MAKDNPYFKFYVSEYNDGDITLCSFEAQGLFINICSLYWSKGGDVQLSKLKKRFNSCREDAFDELIDENIIKVKSDEISISFLDEQLAERTKISKRNTENVRKRYEKNTKDVPKSTSRREVVESGSTVEYNIEEKRREEKRRKENITSWSEEDKIFIDKLAQEHRDFWNVKEGENTPLYTGVWRWIFEMDKKQVKFLSQQLEFYKRIVLETGRIKCVLPTWMNGKWNEANYSDEYGETVKRMGPKRKGDLGSNNAKYYAT